MTSFASQPRPAPASGTPVTHAGAGQEAFENALAAARQLLADTVDTINPGTPAAKLLACLERYRAHLAVLVAASRPDAGQASVRELDVQQRMRSVDHARTTRIIAVTYRNRSRFARLRLCYPAGRRGEAQRARAWRSGKPAHAAYDAHLAMELIVGTSELPARKRDLVVILTEYRRALHALATQMLPGTAEPPAVLPLSGASDSDQPL